MDRRQSKHVKKGERCQAKEAKRALVEGCTKCIPVRKGQSSVAQLKTDMVPGNVVGLVSSHKSRHVMSCQVKSREKLLSCVKRGEKVVKVCWHILQILPQGGRETRMEKKKEKRYVGDEATSSTSNQSIHQNDRGS